MSDTTVDRRYMLGTAFLHWTGQFGSHWSTAVMAGHVVRMAQDVKDNGGTVNGVTYND